MPEWSCSALQIRVRRFDSDSGLQYKAPQAHACGAFSFMRCSLFERAGWGISGEPEIADLHALGFPAGYFRRLAWGGVAVYSPALAKGRALFPSLSATARMAKSVDARDLKSLAGNSLSLIHI